MKFRVYGEVKDVKTGQPVVGVSVKLFLDQEELQQSKSAKNGFYEVIVEIDDSRIETGQQLLVTFEMEGYQRQEHRVLATEGAFNLDAKLDAAVAPPKKPFNWLPIAIAGGVVLLLAVIGVILLLILPSKAPKITSFSAEPNSIESGQSATLRWETRKASSVEILIDQNMVSVDLSGSKKVQPIQTTNYELIARNDKGEARASQTVEVKDVVPPELSVTISPSHPNMEEKVIFTIKASDTGGISKIEILVNGTKVNECNGSPCTYEGGPYSLGNVSYEAYAWDNSENKAVTGPSDFTIEDVGEPDVNITLNPSTPTTTEKVTFTATATDPGGINKLEIYVKGAKVKECNESPCTYEGGPYPLGSVSYEAHAWDKSNNEAVAGPNSFSTRDIDAPSVTVSHNPLSPNTEDKVTFTATASDPGGISKVQIYVNGKSVNACTGSPCTYVGGPFPAGNVNYEAQAWDRSNQKAVAGPKSFTVIDVGKPKIDISCNPSKPSTEDKVTFTATASDPGGISRVQIYVNGNKVEECTGSPCRYIGGPYPLGNVSYYAYAYDTAGNRQSTGSNSLAVIDKIPPNVSISPNPFTVNLNQKVTFTASASDSGGVSKVQIYVNGKKMNECTGSPCSYTGGPYGLGDVRYQAYAWDKSGNKGQTDAATLTVMNFNFESGNLAGWTRTGTAFNYQPTLGDNPTMRHRGQPSKHQGNYWIGTYEKHPSNKFAGGSVQGDGPKGTLTSRFFVIQSSKANFLVGGGSGPGVGVQLIVDGKVVMQARGKNNETMERVSWDLSKYVNKTAQLHIVDNEAGGWGHINFDDFQFARFLFPIKPIFPVKPLVIKDLNLPKTVIPKAP